MPVGRVDRGEAIQMIASWLIRHSNARLWATVAKSVNADIEIMDQRTAQHHSVKVAARQFSKSDRSGKNFQMRDAVLRSDPAGVVVMAYLHGPELVEQAHLVKAAWVLSYGDFLLQPTARSRKTTYQCRPLFDPADTDEWSQYRCFSERELVVRVMHILSGQESKAKGTSDSPRQN